MTRLMFKEREAPTFQVSLTDKITIHSLGYSGYVPGVRSENVYGESFGKTSGAACEGAISRGFDQPS